VSGSQTSDRNSKGRAADIVKANAVTEVNGSRFATLLTTNANLNVGIAFVTTLDAEVHEIVNTVLLNGDKSLKF
jgi:hypothetical protein